MAGSKDNRYKVVKYLLQNMEVKTFEDIFEIVPRSRWVKGANIHYDRLGTKVRNPEKFSVKDIRNIAKMFDVDDRMLYAFILALINKKQNKPFVSGKN